MTGFNEEWLIEHNARMVALKRAAPALKIPAATESLTILCAEREALHQPQSDLIAFRLPTPFKLLNEIIRMHWTVRRKYAKKLARDVCQSVTWTSPPMNKARVEIVRYSLGEPDKDGLYGGAKLLIDCLLVNSGAHPNGLGYCVDDSPRHMDLDVRSVKVAQSRLQRTEVSITRII